MPCNGSSFEVTITQPEDQNNSRHWNNMIWYKAAADWLDLTNQNSSLRILIGSESSWRRVQLLPTTPHQCHANILIHLSTQKENIEEQGNDKTRQGIRDKFKSLDHLLALDIEKRWFCFRQYNSQGTYLQTVSTLWSNPKTDWRPQSPRSPKKQISSLWRLGCNAWVFQVAYQANAPKLYIFHV